VKEKVRIPIITVGRLGYPGLANEVLEKGYADFVAIGRPLLADPEFVKKCRSGRDSEIRPCIGCHECFRRIYQSRSISCAVNPACGDEKLYEIHKSSRKKKVLVIGGGIAGLEAARVSALRGHYVTLYEKSTSLGGLLNIIGRNSLKSDYSRLLDFQVSQVRKEGVRLCLGQAVDIQTVQDEKPDVVFLATGSIPVEIFKSPLNSPVKCISALDVLCGNAETGSSIVIVGGGATGCEIAVELADGTKSIAICEQMSELAPDLFHANRDMIMEQLEKKGVRIYTDTKCERITSDGIKINLKDGSDALLRADTVIISIGMKPVDVLLPELNAIVDEVYPIGDCVSPRKVKDAVWEAYKRAVSI
jgi:2-enoate reductase